MVAAFRAFIVKKIEIGWVFDELDELPQGGGGGGGWEGKTQPI